MKEPKRYTCKDCGHKSSRRKVVWIGQCGVARCTKCSGILKESDEWTMWNNKKLDEWRFAATRI